MLEALLWGAGAGLSLVVGALVSFYVPIGMRTLTVVMAFGAGVLISAVAFELTEEAYRVGGADAVAFGLIAGAIVYFLLDSWIDRRAEHKRKRTRREAEEQEAKDITLGAALDAVPESAVIGMSLIGGASVSVPILIAVLLSNLPESIGASAKFLDAGYSRARVLRLWLTVVVVSGLAAAAGYAALGDASGNLVATTQSFAAGALLAMLTDTMVPEAFENGGKIAGVVTVLGFGSAFLLTTL